VGSGFGQEEALMILTSPLEYQVIQRNAENRASVPVSGRVVGSLTPGGLIEVRFGDNKENGTWRTLNES